MGLPRYCSASGMFADSAIDGFQAIVRKRCASIIHRVRGSANNIFGIVPYWDIGCVYIDLL